LGVLATEAVDASNRVSSFRHHLLAILTILTRMSECSSRFPTSHISAARSSRS
jgi:hypothetical protein